MEEIDLSGRLLEVLSQPWIQGFECIFTELERYFESPQIHSVELPGHGPEGVVPFSFHPGEDARHQSLKPGFIPGVSPSLCTMDGS